MLHLALLAFGMNAPTRPDLRSPEARGVASDVAHARGLRDLGPLDRHAQVTVGVLLKVRRPAELEQLTVLQSDRHSPLFHHYLSSAQFNAYFSPDPTSYRRVLATLQRNGFRITQQFRNRTFVQAAAPVATAERYFSTSIHSVSQAGVGTRYANVTPARMPADLRDMATSISGLHTVQTMHHPLHFADPNAVRSLPQYRAALARVRNARRPSNVPTPISSSTPSAPGPNPTIPAGNPSSDYVSSTGGYGPEIYANAYDYPVQHGYGGTNHPIGNIIEADVLRSDLATEWKTFGINRTGKIYTYCAIAGGGSNCFGSIGAPDPVGEATLDANIITSLAPNSDFYVYLAPGFDDIQLESAYVMAVDQNIVETVNSSFGSCETDDPSFAYATNYIAMEGAALGMTFEASTGDTGSGNCGTYVTNGAPQTETNASIPSSNYYFTAVGGTNFLPVTACTLGACYTRETAWTFGGGGHSVYEPIPSWQLPAAQAQTLVNETSTTFRNTPDIVMQAAAPPFDVGVGFAIFDNGAEEAGGGTSVASPMWTAMQAEINQVQGSRNGWVNPGLYAIYTQFPTFAFHTIIGGTNGVYAAVPGYNDAIGMGSPLGWELAGAENGSAGLPARGSNPTPFPSAPPTAAPAPTPTPSPTPLIVPSPVGNAFVVTTIAGNGTAASVDGTGTGAELSAPSGIAYTATAQGTDAELFVAEFGAGNLRGLDLVSGAVTTYNNTTWNNAIRSAASPARANSKLYGLTVGPFIDAYSGTVGNGLYVSAAGDNQEYVIALPTTKNATAEVRSSVAAPTMTVFDAVRNFYDVSESSGTLGYSVQAPTNGTGLAETAATGLPPTGNYGMTADGSTPANLIVTNSAKNSISMSTELTVMSTISAYTSGAPLNGPKEIVYVSGVGAFFVANCGGNNIVRVDSSTKAMKVVAGDGAARELNGMNTGAEFNCPFGIATDGTNLFVTDLGGNTVRKITALQ